MNNFKNYVGRYFERKLNNDNEAIVFKIDEFDGKNFIVTEYKLQSGSSTLEIKLKKLTSFLDKDNFREITEDRYEIIKFLCKDPYVIDWTDENNPKYYMLINDKKLLKQ